MTEEKVLRLIGCPKRVLHPLRGSMKKSWAHLRNSMELEGVEGREKFTVFVRQNVDFPENFSIGLVFHSPDDATAWQLLRFNGSHGPHQQWGHHEFFHVHRLSRDEIDQGIREPRKIDREVRFRSLEEALAEFLDLCHIQINPDRKGPTMPNLPGIEG